MTLALSYLDDLSRVRITGSDLAPGTVTVERSINGGGLWQAVRGGLAVTVDDTGAFTLDDYEFAPGRENQYRIRAVVDELLDAPSADQTGGDAWTVPSGVDSLDVGAIGAGGSAPSTGDDASAGGGGGAYAGATLAVTPGETLHLLVGQADHDGGDGGRSAVIRDSTLLVAAPGGGASTATTPGTGGSDAPPGAVGTTTNAGGAGGARSGASGSGGGGGAAGSAVGDGGDGEDSVRPAGANGEIGGAGGQAPGTPWVGRAWYYNEPSIGEPAMAPSVTAEQAGLLVCAWSGAATAGWTIPASMTEAVTQTGTAPQTMTIATEQITATGPVGVRSATGSDGFSWSAATALLYGDAVAIADTQTAAAVGGAVAATTAAADVGDVVAVVQSVTFGGFDAADYPALDGPGWTLLADYDTFNSPRTRIWIRRVTEPGPVTVTAGAPGAPTDDHLLTVLVLSGVDADTAESGAGGFGGTGGNAATAPGGDGQAPGGGGGGQGAFGDAPGSHGAPGRVTLSSWTGGTEESAAITPVIDSVWLKSIRWPMLNRAVSIGSVEGGGRTSRTTTFQVQGSPFPVAVSDLRSSQTFTLTLRTATAEQARDLDLVLAAETEFLIQVPPEKVNIPGGYVTTGDYDPDRFGPVSTRRRWPLPCTVIAPPSPDIIPGTLTWATVERLYGSWEALAAANPTWGDLLDLVGDPGDAVTL